MFSGNSHSVTFLGSKLQKRNICTETTSERHSLGDNTREWTLVCST